MTREGYQWANTEAARMLLSGLERAKEQRGLSVRQLAKQLNYKQAVVLSHMANGRAPIPIDRAEEIAQLLEMSPQKFLRAVIEQRHPEVNWRLISKPSDSPDDDGLASELELILDAPLSKLSAEQRRVLREVAAEQRPSRRWLTVHELPFAERWRAHQGDLGRQSQSEVDEILSLLEDRDRRDRENSENGQP